MLIALQQDALRNVAADPQARERGDRIGGRQIDAVRRERNLRPAAGEDRASSEEHNSNAAVPAKAPVRVLLWEYGILWDRVPVYLRSWFQPYSLLHASNSLYPLHLLRGHHSSP